MTQTRRAAAQRRRLFVAAAATLAGVAAASAFCAPRLPPRTWAPGSKAAVPPTARAASESELYEVLGVGKDATVSEIKKAYYREARESHPDKHPGNDGMLQRFQDVAEAYQTLADPVRRQQYDLQGLAGLAQLNVNASRLFGPPPWRVLIGKTNHWLWEEGKEESMLGLLVASVPNGIAGVTMKTLTESYKEAVATNVAVLLDRVSQAQAEDTVEALEEYGIAVKAEAIEGERTNEKESPLMYFRRIQRELGEASENLRMAAIEIAPAGAADDKEPEFEKWIDAVRALRSELRAAATELDEFKEEQKQAKAETAEAPKAEAAPKKDAKAKKSEPAPKKESKKAKAQKSDPPPKKAKKAGAPKKASKSEDSLRDLLM